MPALVDALNRLVNDPGRLADDRRSEDVAVARAVLSEANRLMQHDGKTIPPPSTSVFGGGIPNYILDIAGAIWDSAAIGETP